MIETRIFSAADDYRSRLEFDIEDDVAVVVLRVVNGGDVPLHAEVGETDGRLHIIDAAPGKTVELRPDPPMFLIPDISNPSYSQFGVV